MTSQDRIRVAICGAGIGGLTLAVSLKNADKVDVDIYEAASELTEIGAGIVTQPRQWKILQKLGLEEDLNQYCMQAHRDLEVHRVDMETEKPIMTFPEPARGKAFHRAHFQKVIVGNLSPRHRENIHFSKRLVGYSPSADGSGITLKFADGTQATADLLVGADGIKSAVRGQMYTDFAEGCKEEAEKEKYLDEVNPHWTGLSMVRSVIPKEKDATVGKVEGPISFAGPGIFLVGYSIANGTLLNSSTVVSQLSQHHIERKPAVDGAWVTPGLPEGFKEKFRDSREDVKAIVRNLENPSQWLVHTVGPLPTWVDGGGRVALLGDAAHAMIPHMGSGAGQAMEDGVLLGTLLAHPHASKSAVPALLKIYDAIRRPFGNDIQRRSNVCYEQFAAFADVDPAHPKKLVGEMLENWNWLWETTNEDQVEEAVKAMDAVER